MLAFSLPKRQHVSVFVQQSIKKPLYSNSNVSSNNNTVYQSPIPATADSDRNKGKKQSDKNQNKLFKIRTFSTKANPKKVMDDQTIKLLKIGPMEAVTIDKISIKDAQVNLCLNQGCAGDNQSPQHVHQTRKQGVNMKRKKNTTKQSSLFNEIQIFKKVARTSLTFRTLDLSVFDPLSHQPYIWFSQSKYAKERQFLNSVVIISFRLLNMQPKNYIKYQARQINHRATQNCAYSIETINCLKQINDSTTSSSFLGQSRIFYKVSSAQELNQLHRCLSQNNFNNFCGIIDTHDKYAETYNFYNLRGVTNQESCVVFIEQQQTLHTQIPVFHGQNVLFLTCQNKNNTYCAINQMIKVIKQMQYVPAVKEESSVIICKPCASNNFDNQKENAHPNTKISAFNSFRHPNRTGKYSPTKSKREQNNPNLINLPSNATMKFISLDMNDLLSRINQSQGYKVIKKGLKEKRNSSLSLIQGVNQSQNTSTDRATEKYIRKQTNSSSVVELDGDFKQKMMKYVRILQNERINKLYQTKTIKKEQINKPQQNQDQISDLQQLTVNLTTRLKTKTPFQLVGDILKNNCHIAGQIGKYLDETKLFHKQASFPQKNSTISNEYKHTLQLTLYQI